VTDFFRFENRTCIQARLVAQTAVSVGSRVSLLPSGSDLPVIKTPDGLPFIPGSSLKGVVRSYLERILRTLGDAKKAVQGERLWACDPLDKECCCVPPGRKKELVEEFFLRARQTGENFDELLARAIWKESCTACRLFGHQWMAGRIAFRDALLVNAEELPQLVEVRDGVGIDRDLGSAKASIKYDFETVPRGAVFGFQVVVENAQDWEVGLLFLGLEALREGMLPVGGKTTRGLGFVTLEDVTVRSFTVEDLLLRPEEGKVRTPQEFIDAFTQALQ